jgi:membrane associated rhomboid family serine protease
MTPTPVGMRCPECSRQKTQVRTMSTMYGAPVLTYVLIGINVVLFLGSRSGGNNGYFDLVLAAGPVANGEIWRAFTGGFLHARAINPMESGLGPTILINLLFQFLFPGLNVSIGGHIFGLAGGLVSGWIITRALERRMSVVVPILACVVIGGIALVATYYEARAKVGLV